MLQELGVDVTDGGTVRDEVEDVRAALTRAKDFDFTVTSGGVSVGDHDLVKKVFAEFGGINFWKVRIKPGKPVAFGRLGDRGHFLGLPGNPVSSLVTFKLFLEPALFAWHHASYSRSEIAAIVETDHTRHAGRTEFLRARVSIDDEGRLHAEILKGQGSHMLGTLQHTNALLKVEHDVSEIKRGQSVPVVLLTPQLPVAQHY
jgi:molybdopterin molybdotransferase